MRPQRNVIQALKDVLIVDDDDTVREFCAASLSGAGYIVTQAADGLEALKFCRIRKPDIIILDLDMPVMNGWQFRHEQIQDPALEQIPTIIVSGYSVRLIDPVMRGVCQYLRKPFLASDLLALVESHISR